MRWVCPRCNVAKLAPTRPRRDDARTYCLPCSGATGRLLRREAPVLVARRAERDLERRQDLADARAAARARLDAFPACLSAEWARMVELPSAREGFRERHPLAPRSSRPRLELRRSRKFYRGMSYGGRVVVWIGRLTTPSEARMLLLHELAHEAAPAREQHSEVWRARYKALVDEYVGSGSFALPELTAKARGRYVTDRAVVAHLQVYVEAAVVVGRFLSWAAGGPS